MITTEITYGRNFHISREDRYLFERIEIKGIIEHEKEETPQQALDIARKEATENHVKNNPNLFPDGKYVPLFYEGQEEHLPVIQKANSYDDFDRIEDDLEKQINSCKEIKILETYRLIVKGNPELQKAYDEKYLSLQNKEG
jgi:hypothetical protein